MEDKENKSTDDTGVLRVPDGDGNIEKRIEDAIEYAKKEKGIVLFEFNGTPVIVSPGSLADEIYLNWGSIRALHQKVTELEKRLKN